MCSCSWLLWSFNLPIRVKKGALDIEKCFKFLKIKEKLGFMLELFKNIKTISGEANYLIRTFKDFTPSIFFVISKKKDDDKVLNL